MVNDNLQPPFPPVFSQPIDQNAQFVVDHGPGGLLDGVRRSYELDCLELGGPDSSEKANEVLFRLAFWDLDRNLP
jgi:hypothetical protein